MAHRKMQMPLTLILKDIPNKRCRAWVEEGKAPPAQQALARKLAWARGERFTPHTIPYLVWEEQADAVRLEANFWKAVVGLAGVFWQEAIEPPDAPRRGRQMLMDFWGQYGSLFQAKGNRLPLGEVAEKLVFFCLWGLWVFSLRPDERTKVPPVRNVELTLLERFPAWDTWIHTHTHTHGQGLADIMAGLPPDAHPRLARILGEFLNAREFTVRVYNGQPKVFPAEPGSWPRIPRPPAFKSREALIHWVRDEVLLPNAASLLPQGLVLREWHLDEEGLAVVVQPREPYVLALLQVVGNFLGERPVHACPCGCGRNVPGHKKYFSRACLRRGNVKRAVLQRYYAKWKRSTITAEEYTAVKKAVSAVSRRLGTRPAGAVTRDVLEEEFESAAKRAISRLRQPVSKEDGKRRRLSE